VVIFHRVPTAWVFGCLLICASAAADDVDPDNDGSQYAWASNLGWLNAEPLGEGGPGLSLSDEAATGWLWSANVGWVSFSCSNSESCAEVDYGIELAAAAIPDQIFGDRFEQF
jgi:hypothetical protein